MDKGIETIFSIGLKTNKGRPLHRGDTIANTIDPTLAAFDLKGFSITDGTGYWEGKQEPTLLVSIITDGAIQPADVDGVLFRANTLALKIARAIAIELEQDCVLYSLKPVIYGFVPGKV